MSFARVLPYSQLFNLFYARGCWCLSVVVFVVGMSSDVHAQDDTRFRFFKDGIARNIADAEFTCSYRYLYQKIRSGDGESVIAVISDMLDSSGKISKRGGEFAFSNGEMFLSENRELLISLQVSAPGVNLSAPGVKLSDPRRGVRQASVNAGTVSAVTKPSYGVSTLDIPASPVNTIDANDLFGLNELVSAGKKVDMNFAETGANSTVTATCLAKLNDIPATYTCTLEFEIRGNDVLCHSRVATFSSANDGKILRTVKWRFSQFSDTAPFLPSYILRSTWDVAYQDQQHQDVWIRGLWTSSDLGDSLPRDEDFEILIPANTIVYGELGNPDRTVPRKLSPNAFINEAIGRSGDMIQNGKVVGNISEDSPPRARAYIPGYIRISVTLLSFGFVLALILSWMKRRRE